MKKCIVFANCHSFPIRRYLLSSRTFRYNYQVMEVPLIQNCNRETGIGDHLLRDCDLFIYMRTSDAFGPYLSSNYVLSKLPERCTRISIGNAYFKPYYPQFTYHNKENSLYGYEDQNVLRLLREGVSRERIISILSDEEFYSQEAMRVLYTDFMNDFRRREIGIDIPLADFIEQHYQKEHLFCTVCHPRYHIIRYLVMNILQKIGISPREIANVLYDVDFIDLIHPIYPSVIKHLNLRFLQPGARIYVMGNEKLSFQEYIARYVDIHSKELQVT